MRRSVLLIMVFLAVLIVFGACKKPRKVVLTKEQQGHISESVSETEPTPKFPVNAVLDGKIRLVGFDLSPTGVVAAGSVLDITWYWQALEPVTGDWKVFVHFESPGRKRTVHDHHPVGELYRIAKWKKGEYIKDSQRIEVTKDFPAGAARIYVGIFDERAWAERQQNLRMKVVNAADAKISVDDEGRIQTATIQVSVGKGWKGKSVPAAATGAPRTGPASSKAEASETRVLMVHKVAEAPKVDGRLKEDIWKRIRPTQPFVRPDGRAMAPGGITQARMAWDDTNLYLAVNCQDHDIWNVIPGRDQVLWEQDVVELYLDPGSDGKDYIELQFAPSEHVFDAVFSSHRRPNWELAAKRLNIENLQAKVQVQGSLNSRDTMGDVGWELEVAIPWAELPGIEGPPEDNTKWSVNLYRIDGPSPKRQGFMGAWSPAGNDFHNTEGFGIAHFRTTEPPALRPKVKPKSVGSNEETGPTTPKSAPAPKK